MTKAFGALRTLGGFLPLWHQNFNDEIDELGGHILRVDCPQGTC